LRLPAKTTSSTKAKPIIINITKIAIIFVTKYKICNTNFNLLCKKYIEFILQN
jgi:hypothetical protein